MHAVKEKNRNKYFVEDSIFVNCESVLSDFILSNFPVCKLFPARRNKGKCTSSKGSCKIGEQKGNKH